MKVMMTADGVGGVWTYVLELAAALAKHDVEVVVACMGPRPTADQCRRARTLANLSLYCANHPLEWAQQPWQGLEASAQWLRELFEAEAPQLVHFNGYAHAALSWPCPVLVVAHSCVVSWWRAVHGCAPPPVWDDYRERVRQGLQSAAAVVAPTQTFLDEICALYAPQAAASVIYNGREQPPRASESQRLPMIFAAGRLWDQGKNLAVLDAVAKAIPWRIVAAGSTMGAEGCRSAPRFLECVGPLSPIEMAGWLRQASIFVHPALYEPFGLAVLEAAAAGCALVLADIPTLRELWDGAATFVAPRDVAGWQAALQSLIREPAQLAAQALRAQQRAQQFSRTRMVDSYVALYRQLLVAHNPARSAAA